MYVVSKRETIGGEVDLTEDLRPERPQISEIGIWELPAGRHDKKPTVGPRTPNLFGAKAAEEDSEATRARTVVIPKATMVDLSERFSPTKNGNRIDSAELN
jgi:hypothetical protein